MHAFHSPAIILTLLSSWGDSNHIGLTRLHLLDSTLSPISISPSNISVPTHVSENGLEQLICEDNVMSHDNHMWCTPMSDNISIKIKLDHTQKLGGVRIWNYNKSLEDTYKGVCTLYKCTDRQIDSFINCLF